MAFLVVLIVDDVDKCRPILDAWEAAGAGGVTILESSGIGRVRPFEPPLGLEGDAHSLRLRRATL